MRHSLTLRREDFTTSSLNNIDDSVEQVIDSRLLLSFFFFFTRSGYGGKQKRQITKSPRHLAQSWYDGIVLKWITRIYCVLVNMSVFSFCDIDSPLFRTYNAKEEHLEENRSGHYFKRADFQWSSYPSGWWGSMSLVFTAVIPNIAIILLPEYPVTFSFSSWFLLTMLSS